MKYIVSSTPNSELHRILFTASAIKNNLYQDLGYLILPKLYPKFTRNQVVFPFSSKLDKNFWKKILDSKHGCVDYSLTHEDIVFFLVTIITWNLLT